jgi:hypothetical protein
LTDVIKKNGKWMAGGSAISGGMREGFDVGLRNEAHNILSSFKLIVDESLDIKIFSNGEIAAKFPFSKESVFQVNRMKREEDETGKVFDYEGAGSFIENKLHIAMTDEFNFSKYLVFKVFEDTPMGEEHVVSLDYDPVEGGFELGVIDKHHNMTIMYFRKHGK